MSRALRVLALAALVSACGGRKPGEPPEIVVGRHECARCGMIVSEERFSSGWVDEDGSTVAFDDLGEMLRELNEKPALEARAWVRDMKGGSWVRLAHAHLSQVEGLATPMGTGWIAFARKEDLEQFLRSRGVARR